MCRGASASVYLMQSANGTGKTYYLLEEQPVVQLHEAGAVVQ
jgi:hypothetical protein